MTPTASPSTRSCSSAWEVTTRSFPSRKEPDLAERRGGGAAGAHGRLLIITEAGGLWPSGRNRALAFRSHFQADGISVRYCTRLSVLLTRLAVADGRLASRVLDFGLRRMLGAANRWFSRVRERWLARLGRRFDVVYLEKTPSAGLIAALRARTRARLVYDLNDAVWLPWMQRFFGSDVADILRQVDMVTCDNPYGLEFARRYNPGGAIVPEPALVELFDARRPESTRRPGRVVLGWVGSAATAFNLFAIWEPLEQLFQRFDHLVLRLVGVGHDWRLLPRFEKVRCTQVTRYSESDLIREVLGMDIGLYPLFNVEDSYVRGIHKPTVYMAGEACVVASALGENLDLIRPGENGFLAATPGEWLETLSRLAQDDGLRTRAARAGLQTVRSEYSVDRCYQALRNALFPADPAAAGRR